MIKIFMSLFLFVSCRPEPVLEQGFLNVGEVKSVEIELTIDLPPEGAYEKGDVLTFALQSEKEIILSGAPVLKFTIADEDRAASCSQESSKALFCSYTIGEADVDYSPTGDLFIKGLSLNGASATTSEGASVELSIPSNFKLENRLVFLKSPLLWLDATDDSTVFSDSGCTVTAVGDDLVRCWKDKFDSIPFINSSSSARLKSNSINGQNSINFSRDLFLAPSPYTLQSFTAFIVYNVQSWNALNYWIGSVTGSSSVGIGLGFGGAWTGGPQGEGIFVFGRDGLGASGNVSAPVEPSSWGLATYNNDKTFYGSQENAPYASQTPVPEGLNFQGIGSREDFHSCCFHTGNIAEIIIYNSKLDESERRKVWCELSEKHALALIGC